jgi:hypothetical protein
MYSFHGGRLTAQRDIVVDASVYASTPKSLMDKNSKNPRIPIGIARTEFRLRQGQFRVGVAGIVSCVATNKLN